MIEGGSDYDRDFAQGLHDAVAVQEPQEQRMRTEEAFLLLRRGSVGASPQALAAGAGKAEVALHFLVDAYVVLKMQRNRIPEVISRLAQRSEAWAAAAVAQPLRTHARGVMAQLGVEDADNLGSLKALGPKRVEAFLEAFGLALSDLGGDLAQADDEPDPVGGDLAQADDEPDQVAGPVARHPLQQKLEAAISSAIHCSAVELANRGETIFQNLRFALLHMSRSLGGEGRTWLESEAHNAADIYDWLLKFGASRIFYRRQILEVGRILLSNEAWASALINTSLDHDSPLFKDLLAMAHETLPTTSSTPSTTASAPAMSKAPVAPAAQARRLRLLLSRADAACVHKRPIPGTFNLFDPSLPLTLGSQYKKSSSWSLGSCGVAAADWVGASPDRRAIAAARRGFPGPINVAPYVRGAELFNGTDFDWNDRGLAPLNWHLLPGVWETDWVLFERYIAGEVLPGLNPRTTGEVTIAVVTSSQVIEQEFGNRRWWWGSFRSSLCREALQAEGKTGRRAEVLELWYDVLDGNLEIAAEGPDGGRNCRKVADCNCWSS
jgi:hypothetical protein